MALPLEPPIKPALARSAKEPPEGEGWRYEPKYDGFRTIAFREGRDLHLQSRGGKPMNRYFPDVEAQLLEMAADGVVIDGEMVVTVDGIQEFDLLSQRIHPAASRVEKLASETPAVFHAFDLLAIDGESLLQTPFDERRARLEQLDLAPVLLTPITSDRDEAAREWLTGHSEGVIAKRGDAIYLPGERKGMVKIKRLRTADCVVVAFRYGKEENTVGSLILGLYNEAGDLQVVGHTSSFSKKGKRELIDLLEPYRTHERGTGEPSRWKADEDLAWEGLRPELVCEITFDHTTGYRIRHGAKFVRWRDDKPPRECDVSQLAV